eukprot:GILI01028436.1.p1 GENE.GILI01028436.1~~GILI01028436.1.p1  ORF type:complete len:252 (-),score=36.73 GILI01028436.1:208-873(-)
MPSGRAMSLASAKVMPITVSAARSTDPELAKSEEQVPPPTRSLSPAPRAAAHRRPSATKSSASREALERNDTNPNGWSREAFTTTKRRPAAPAHPHDPLVWSGPALLASADQPRMKPRTSGTSASVIGAWTDGRTSQVAARTDHPRPQRAASPAQYANSEPIRVRQPPPKSTAVQDYSPPTPQHSVNLVSRPVACGPVWEVARRGTSANRIEMPPSAIPNF